MADMADIGLLPPESAILLPPAPGVNHVSGQFYGQAIGPTYIFSG
jgi:hypothetical protein